MQPTPGAPAHDVPTPAGSFTSAPAVDAPGPASGFSPGSGAWSLGGGEAAGILPAPSAPVPAPAWYAPAALWTRLQPFLPWISLAGGIYSAFFIDRSYEAVRWIAAMLAGAWGIYALIGLKRRWVSGRRLEGRMAVADRIADEVLGMTSQNLNQEIFFFILPYWIRSTVWTSPGAFVTGTLVLLAAATMIDPLYIGRIARSRVLLYLFQAVLLFASVAFLLPALFAFHGQWALAWSGAITGLFLAPLMLGSDGFLTKRGAGLALGFALVGGLLAWSIRGIVPPVPLRVQAGVVASDVRSRTPADTLAVVDSAAFPRLYAYTPIFAPRGLDDRIVHIWYRDGKEFNRVTLSLRGGRREGFRTWSLSSRAPRLPGRWRVDVRTAAGQLLGRLRFRVQPRG